MNPPSTRSGPLQQEHHGCQDDGYASAVDTWPLHCVYRSGVRTWICNSCILLAHRSYYCCSCFFLIPLAAQWSFYEPDDPFVAQHTPIATCHVCREAVAHLFCLLPARAALPRSSVQPAARPRRVGPSPTRRSTTSAPTGFLSWRRGSRRCCCSGAPAWRARTRSGWPRMPSPIGGGRTSRSKWPWRSTQRCFRSSRVTRCCLQESPPRTAPWRWAKEAGRARTSRCFGAASHDAASQNSLRESEHGGGGRKRDEHERAAASAAASGDAASQNPLRESAHGGGRRKRDERERAAA
jgi:hypothetical protein